MQEIYNHGKEILADRKAKRTHKRVLLIIALTVVAVLSFIVGAAFNYQACLQGICG